MPGSGRFRPLGFSLALRSYGTTRKRLAQLATEGLSMPHRSKEVLRTVQEPVRGGEEVRIQSICVSY